MQKNMQLYQKTKKALRNISQDFCGIATVIGVTGFEPAASWSRTKHSTGLSHTPIACILYHNGEFVKTVQQNNSIYNYIAQQMYFGTTYKIDNGQWIFAVC